MNGKDLRDDKKMMRMDSSSQEITCSKDNLDNVLTHPAVGIVFRTDNILEKICSHLDLDDLKQFRLVSTTCNNEGRRAIIKQDRHWVLVKSKEDDWKRELGRFLRNLEKTAFKDGEHCNLKLLGWIFKRLELQQWKRSLGNPTFFQQWGHYLRKIHLKADKGERPPTVTVASASTSHFINVIHNLLTVCCPNLDELVLMLQFGEYMDMSSVFHGQLESLEFPSPLQKLKCIRIKHLDLDNCSDEEGEVLRRFFVKLVRAAGTALEILDIDYEHDYSFKEETLEAMMLDSISLNVGVSNFQSLKEITLKCAGNVGNLSHTVQKCFPGLTKLILDRLYTAPNVAMQPESFPALKSLTILDIGYEDITNTNGGLAFLLHHFPNLEQLTISSNIEATDEWPVISAAIGRGSQNLRCLTFKTEYCGLGFLLLAVSRFPNLVTLNLLEFGRKDVFKPEPEYSFGELIDTISPLGRLQHPYVNHAFHTPSQLVAAVQLTSNFPALDTFILSQAAHDLTRQAFNVSLYLIASDPEFQFILNCDGVTRLKSVHLLDFRAEVEGEAAAKGGHVSFGPICPCYKEPWISDSQSRLKQCHNRHC